MNSIKINKKTINWGILSTANIGLNLVIPAIIGSNNGVVLGIASRNIEKADEVAKKFGIKHTYGSYDELLSDPQIDAIYNPLPNNLHLEYTLKALEHGKHVLCEKPIGLSVAEAAKLAHYLLQYPNLKVMEGFMYKFHPQWVKAKEIVSNGQIGKINIIQTLFSYHNTDGNNIRNKKEAGGGVLMDIGCYCVSFPRFILSQEPTSVISAIQYDTVFETDFLATGILNFDNNVTASFTCTTQAFPFQRTYILGDKGQIEIEFPCNAPIDADCKIILRTATEEKVLVFKANQYQLQCEAFANSILNNKPVPYPIIDAVNNMRVLEALVQSSKLKAAINVS
jgi:predicted dehydrogenase